MNRRYINLKGSGARIDTGWVLSLSFHLPTEGYSIAVIYFCGSKAFLKCFYDNPCPWHFVGTSLLRRAIHSKTVLQLNIAIKCQDLIIVCVSLNY